MKKPIHCNIIFGNNTDPHLSQIFAGYQMLQDQKILRYDVSFNPQYINDNYIHNVLIEVNFNNRIRICYDLSDGYQSFLDMEKFDKILDSVDFYFKRSNNIEKNKILKNRNKIKTLGFNYPVSCKNNYFDKFFFTSYNIQKIKKYINYLRFEKGNHKELFYQNFENKSNDQNQEDYKILFSVRLWDPEKLKLENIKNGFPNLTSIDASHLLEKWRNDYNQVTLERINQVRILKDYFGENFVGGVSKSPYSTKIASDIIAPYEIVNKSNYMQLIKGNFICVANRGLHHSIPWKFGEYIAASRAIVTETLAYETTGNFQEGKNYLTFDTSEKLLEQTKYLIENPKIIHQLEKNNQDYYQEFLRPDQLIMRTLDFLLIEA